MSTRKFIHDLVQDPVETIPVATMVVDQTPRDPIDRISDPVAKGTQWMHHQTLKRHDWLRWCVKHQLQASRRHSLDPYVAYHRFEGRDYPVAMWIEDRKEPDYGTFVMVRNRDV